MKLIFIFAAGLGLVGLVALAWAVGFDPVAQAFEQVGWGVVVVALVRVVETSGAGVAWAVLSPVPRPGLTRICILLRWVRESVNCLLPVAQVGGELIGARLLSFYRVEGSLAGATILVDMLVQTATQFVFTLVGLGTLIAFGGDASIVRIVAVGLVIMAPALVGFFVAQRYGGVRLVEKALARITADPDWAALGKVSALNERLIELYGHRRRILAALVVHQAIWFVGVMEVWFALRFMGHPVGYGEALVIESLGQAVRGAAFAVPGAIGVQEGGFVALCAVFGIPAPAAIALSLVKRMPEIVLGLPGLAVWQALEGRRLMRRGAADTPAASR